MSPQSSIPSSRQSRQPLRSNAPDEVPFLHDTADNSGHDLTTAGSDLENGISRQDAAIEHDSLLDNHSARSPPTWRVPILKRLFIRARRLSRGAIEKSSLGRPSLVRRILRIAAILLMLLGLLNLLTSIIGVALNLPPDDVSFSRHHMSDHLPSRLTEWPTDATANIHPIECASHNDYWRKEPLFSALSVGCTGVEADVWLYNDDLYVGHNVASLSSNRTLRSLYIDPLLKILDKQNPVTDFHTSLDNPRHGVFDTAPLQTLILLIDFKKDGEALWPHVSAQLQPLREKKYLTYFNGTDVVDGPITIVVTGNAPWNRVVANPTYRDLFFDAPLDIMANAIDPDSASALAEPNDSLNNPSNPDPPTATEGQGRAGAAPLDPMAYSRANSYYASVSFKKAILGFPIPIQYPWRATLTQKQLALIRAQIAGAHKRGLKVRYWSVPGWPKGLEEYLWRVLVREGVDYLNVDDLRAAKDGRWGRKWEKGVGGWRWTGWFLDRGRRRD